MKNEITLSVQDRLILKTLLPKEGRLIEMMLVRGIERLIDFTIDEINDFDMKDIPGGGVSFDVKKSIDKSYTISREQRKILKDIPERLDQENRVTIYMLPLIDLITEL